MTDFLIFHVLQGLGYGFAAAVQPGPFQTYLISQTLARGWKSVLPSALAPLVSDGPIILLSLFLLTRLPDWLQRILYIAGGLFIFYLAYGAFKMWRRGDSGTLPQSSSVRQSLIKAALTNALSPVPYVYWTLVLGPILLPGWRQSPASGISFLLSFYFAIVCCLGIIIFSTAFASRLGANLNRLLLGGSVVVLACFGVYQVYLGLR